MSTNSEPRPMGGEPNQLAELLACEQELAVQLARAQEDARRLVDEARAEAARAEAALEGSLQAEAERLRASIREEIQASLREIAARTRERIARFEAVSDEEVARLADAAFLRLIGREGAP
jgi:vacuolar-type H+-ATPase subunit H